MNDKKREKRIRELEQEIAGDDRACHFLLGLNVGLAIANVAIAILIILL